MKKIVGLIVNPIAGMGGKVGLKGTDGKEILAQAIARGAKPESPAKAARALAEIAHLKDDIHLLTCPGDLGEAIARELGFTHTVIEIANRGTETSAEDTIHAAR